MATIDTECGHCRQPIRLQIDSDLAYRVAPDDAAPLVGTPFVNVAGLTPSIIDGF